MSLIRVRRSRKKAGADVKKPKSVKLLVLLLGLVIFVIWLLSTRFG
jgi:hypothetical protein